MNSKERVLATLNRQAVDRTPLDCWLYQKQFLENLEAEYGSRSKFMDEYNLDLATGLTPWPNQTGRQLEVEELDNFKPIDARDPFWLTFDAWNPDFGGMNVREAIDEHGDRRAIVALVWGIIEGTNSILGIESCWANLALEPEIMGRWFLRYADWLGDLIGQLKEAGVDIVLVADDWGGNKNLLFNPKTWRALVKPASQRLVKNAKAHGINIALHSDGYIMDILPDIVHDIGFQAMHPVQESAGMDIAKVKQDFGKNITVYGSLDVVDGLYTHDGDDLDNYIRRVFEIYAPGGGYIFNTGHFVQPDIPVERLKRAYGLANELALKYGAA